MDSVVLWEDQDREDHYESIQRKRIRDSSNIFELNDKSFMKNFRLSKDAFKYVLKEISDELRTSYRSTAVPKIIKLAATLKFFAQGGYQHQLGQDWHVGLAQPTMSICIKEVSTAIEKILCPKHINFLKSEEEKNKIKNEFYERSRIPGIIGVIDGTHIQIIRPSEEEHLYFNRKLKHSINAMVICDHEMFITSINARFPGASHDAHVWKLSTQRNYLLKNFHEGDKTSWIIGDSGYPLEPWLLTPYSSPGNDNLKLKYNEKFCSIRSIIERTFGILKGRFRCLLAARELHYAPKKAVQILNACAALHNICLSFKVDLPAGEEVPTNDDDDMNEVFIEENNIDTYLNQAKKIRDQIKNYL